MMLDTITLLEHDTFLCLRNKQTWVVDPLEIVVGSGKC